MSKLLTIYDENVLSNLWLDPHLLPPAVASMGASKTSAEQSWSL